jgi:hypothetical protein
MGSEHVDEAHRQRYPCSLSKVAAGHQVESLNAFLRGRSAFLPLQTSSASGQVHHIRQVNPLLGLRIWKRAIPAMCRSMAEWANKRNSRTDEAPLAGSTVSAKLTNRTLRHRLSFDLHNRYISTGLNREKLAMRQAVARALFLALVLVFSGALAPASAQGLSGNEGKAVQDRSPSRRSGRRKNPRAKSQARRRQPLWAVFATSLARCRAMPGSRTGAAPD